MMYVHGVGAQELSAWSVGLALDRLVAVPVDVGTFSAMAMVVDFSGRQLAARSSSLSIGQGWRGSSLGSSRRCRPRRRWCAWGWRRAGDQDRPDRPGRDR